MKRLQSLSYKTLFTILFFSIAGIVFFLKIGGKTQKVSAAWWDEMWHYRKAIYLTNSGANQTNTQIKLLTNYDLSSLVSSNKLQSDLDDIRFTDVNGNLMKFWIEDATNNSADIWVVVPSLVSQTTILMYYGNPSAQNGETIMGLSTDNPGISCKAIQLSGGFSDRIYYIDPDGLEPTNAYKTYCDMTNDSGGWTLMMKAEGNTTTFDYNATYWTTNNTLNPTDTDINTMTDAKFESFNSLQINEIRATWPQTGHKMIETVSLTTPLLLFQTTLDLGPTMTQFDYTNFPYQTGYQRYGFNLTCFASRKVRWGWMMNNEADCGSNDCSAGIGMMNYNSTTNGGYVTCCSSKPNGVYPLRVRIWGRETNIVAPNISFLSTSLQSEETGTAPIAYWKFDEGVGTTAYDSAGASTGTLTGTTLPSWQNEESCISAKCLSFNGNNNQVSISNPEQINTLSSFSVGGWIYMNNYPTLWEGTMFSKAAYNTNWQGFGFGVRGQSDGTGKGKLIFYIENNPISPSLIHVYGTSVLNINKWYYISATYNKSNGQVNLYVNGKKETTQTVSSNISDNSAIPYIGQLRPNYGVFPGLLDDIKFYSYARTADQIKQDYNSRGSMSGSSVNLGVQSNTAPSLKSKLVGYWKFDEGNGTTVYDSSINQKNVTLMGATLPVWQTTPCISGKCIYINSNNASPNNSNFDFNVLKQGQETASWTLSTWFKPDGNQGGTERIILGRPGCHSGIYAYPNQLIFAIKTDACWTNAKEIIYTPPDMQSWYHLVAVYDNRSMYFYVNGKLIGTNTFTGTIYPHGNGLYLGSYATYTTKGWIDESKVYNYALTDEEVKQDYNAGSAIQFGSTNQSIGGTTTSLEYCIPGDTSYCAPPIAEYKMDEGVGTSIVDTSGNNNTGAISGTTFTQGKIGKSLSFNGTSDYVSIPTFTYTTNATISVWVKGSYINGNQIIVGSPNSVSLGIYNIGSSKGVIGFSNTSKAVGIANNFINDSWNHLSVVIDNSGNATYYCNGQLLSNSGTNNWSWASGTYIGRRDTGTYFKGQIDQLKIYNYARTPAQIAYDYNKGGPVGWWKFDECQGNMAYDWSGNQNNGTITVGASGSQNSLGTCAIGTSATWTNGATGKINSSLNFDGVDDYINIGNSIPSFSKGISISVWAYPKSVKNWARFIDFGNGSQNNNIVFSRSGTSNSLYFEVKNGTSNGTSVQAPNAIELNKWQNFIVTENDSGVVKLYKNGNLLITGNTTIPLEVIRNNNYIGRSNWSGDSYYDGQIDDVRIYNYALTSEQIKQIYNGGAVNFR